MVLWTRPSAVGQSSRLQHGSTTKYCCRTLEKSKICLGGGAPKWEFNASYYALFTRLHNGIHPPVWKQKTLFYFLFLIFVFLGIESHWELESFAPGIDALVSFQSGTRSLHLGAHHHVRDTTSDFRQPTVNPE